jgi:hypothetical protein
VSLQLFKVAGHWGVDESWIECRVLGWQLEETQLVVSPRISILRNSVTEDTSLFMIVVCEVYSHELCASSPLSLVTNSDSICSLITCQYTTLILYLSIIQVSQEEGSISWEVIVLIILSKKGYMYDFQDITISLYSS